jgi:3-phenylpropionate/trans-cinnamate dioxygenase ferredoxin reductase subunit
MAKCNLNINGKVISSRRGDTIMDAALGGGVFIPQDCCSGQCETCRVRVAWGTVEDRGTAYGDTVLACQATLTGDATVTFEEIPPASIVKGRVSEISSLSPDILQVVIDLAEPMNLRPGSMSACASPASRARVQPDGAAQRGDRRGRAYPPREKAAGRDRLKRVRPQYPAQSPGARAWAARQRVSARAARRPDPDDLHGHRLGADLVDGQGSVPESEAPELSIVAGARDPESLYMKPALDWLKQMGVSEIIVTARERAHGPTRLGTPDAFLPPLTSKEVVYVAGASRLVNPVRERAAAAGARCYADPFTPSRHAPGIADRVAGFMRAVRRPQGLRLSV